MTEEGKCIKCGSNPIVNRRFKLCFWCNFKRLHKGLSYNQYTYLKQKESSSKRLKNMKNDIEDMEAVYLKVFNAIPPFCQECGEPLPKIFRDKDGKVIAKYQYSHVLPKSCYPEFKEDVDNFNRLCLDDHTKWENGNRRSMKIWQLNIQKPVIGDILIRRR